MKKVTMVNLFYFFTIFILIGVHCYYVLANTGFKLPLYGIVTITGCILFLLYKYAYSKVKNLLILGIWKHAGLFFAQFLIIGLYSLHKIEWVYFMAPVLFLIIEHTRLSHTQLLESYVQRVEQLEKAQKDINDTFSVIRSERHDFLKHITAVHFLLEKKDFREAARYMDGLVESYEETNLSIKGEEGIVAGLLHRIYQQAKHNGVIVSYQFDLPLSTLPLTNQQLVGLIGNVLSNAYEACLEWKAAGHPDAKMVVEFYKRSGVFIFVCKNSSLDPGDNRFDTLFERFGTTSKGAGHEGLGTKVIADIVSQNNGFLDFTFKDNQFSLKLKFPSIQ